MPNPSGLCKCGCGGETSRSTTTNSRRGYKKGEHVDYIRGHSSLKYERTWHGGELPLCACGCGQTVELAKNTNPKFASIVGQPNRFVRGHWNRPVSTYEVEDRGYETPCHIWQGSMNNTGYPRSEAWNRDGTERTGTVLVHRQVWIEANGDPGPLMDVHHKCEITACVNLSHLELWSRAQHLRAHRGIPPVKYDAICDAIRSAEESQAGIARRFGVSKVFIWRLRKELLGLG